MSRKIHLTESQVREIVDKLNEDNIEEGNELNVNYQKPPTGVANVQDMTNQMTAAKKAAPGAKVNMVVSGEDLNVMESCYTKKQIKEAKLRYLKEHSTAYSKKDFKNRFMGK